MKLPNHILVIRLSALGDIAMTIPVLKIVARTYPEVKLTVVSRLFFKPLFESIPNCSFLEADVYGRHKGIKIVNLAREAKSLGIDAVADLHNVIRSNIVSKYLKIVGINSATINKGRDEKSRLTQAKGASISQLKTTHQRYADVFAALGYPIELEVLQRERKQLNPKLKKLLGASQKKALGVAPFAAFKSKVYSMDLLKEIISKLEGIGAYHLFMFGGGQQEIELLSNLESNFSCVTNVAGKFSFEEELMLISNLDAMLSMDSGNGHLAAMYGLPVISLWGVTHPFAGFVPFGQPMENQLLADRNKFPLIPTSVYGNKFPAGYELAINSIPPEVIVRRVLEIT